MIITCIGYNTFQLPVFLRGDTTSPIAHPLYKIPFPNAWEGSRLPSFFTLPQLGAETRKGRGGFLNLDISGDPVTA